MPKSPIAELRTHCLSYPEAVEEHPWGECAFKVKTLQVHEKLAVLRVEVVAGLEFLRHDPRHRCREAQDHDACAVLGPDRGSCQLRP